MLRKYFIISSIWYTVWEFKKVVIWNLRSEHRLKFGVQWTCVTCTWVNIMQILSSKSSRVIIMSNMFILRIIFFSSHCMFQCIVYWGVCKMTKIDISCLWMLCPSRNIWDQVFSMDSLRSLGKFHNDHTHHFCRSQNYSNFLFDVFGSFSQTHLAKLNTILPRIRDDTASTEVSGGRYPSEMFKLMKGIQK